MSPKKKAPDPKDPKPYHKALPGGKRSLDDRFREQLEMLREEKDDGKIPLKR